MTAFSRILELKLQKGQQGTLGHAAALFAKACTPGHLQQNYLGIFLVKMSSESQPPLPKLLNQKGLGSSRTIISQVSLEVSSLRIIAGQCGGSGEEHTLTSEGSEVPWKGDM